MSDLVFAQIREEGVFSPNFGDIYTGLVSRTVSSTESHECVSRAEPGRADVVCGQRFQAVQKCWNRWFVVELMTFCLPPGESPANVNMSTHSSKRCRIRHVLRKQCGKEQQAASLSNVSLLYLVFQRLFLPFKIVVIHSLDSIAAFKYS